MFMVELRYRDLGIKHEWFDKLAIIFIINNYLQYSNFESKQKKNLLEITKNNKIGKFWEKVNRKLKEVEDFNLKLHTYLEIELSITKITRKSTKFAESDKHIPISTRSEDTRA